MGVAAFGLAGLVRAAIPFIDRGAARGRSSRVLTYVAYGALLCIIVLTAWGYLEPVTPVGSP